MIIASVYKWRCVHCLQNRGRWALGSGEKTQQQQQQHLPWSSHQTCFCSGGGHVRRNWEREVGWERFGGGGGGSQWRESTVAASAFILSSDLLLFRWGTCMGELGEGGGVGVIWGERGWRQWKESTQQQQQLLPWSSHQTCFCSGGAHVRGNGRGRWVGDRGGGGGGVSGSGEKTWQKQWQHLPWSSVQAGNMKQDLGRRG